MREQSYRSSKISRVMGNPVTYRIVEVMLAKQWQTPTELAKKTHRAISTISGHLQSLRLADLVRYEAKGNQVKYRLKYRKETSGLLRRIAGLRGWLPSILDLNNRNKVKANYPSCSISVFRQLPKYRRRYFGEKIDGRQGWW